MIFDGVLDSNDTINAFGRPQVVGAVHEQIAVAGTARENAKIPVLAPLLAP